MSNFYLSLNIKLPYPRRISFHVSEKNKNKRIAKSTKSKSKSNTNKWKKSSETNRTFLQIDPKFEVPQSLKISGEKLLMERAALSKRCHFHIWCINR